MTTISRKLPLFPLGQVVLFPGMLLRLHVFEERYKAMIRLCESTDRLFGVLLIKSGQEVGQPAIPEEVGSTARILDIEHLPAGRMNITAIGEHRFRLTRPPTVVADGYLVGEAIVTEDETVPAETPRELMSSVVTQLNHYLDALEQIGIDVADELPVPTDDPVSLSFRAAAALRSLPRKRQKLLELDDVLVRLRLVQELLREETRSLKLVGGARGDGAMAGPFSLN